MAVKTVYTIPPDVPFIEALVDGLLRHAGDDPLALADTLVLLPTRRACQWMRGTFRQRMNGRAALLPRMQPLGDLDEDELYFTADSGANLDIPPAITPLRRQLLLTRMIVGMDASMPLDQAALLADALARLLDEVQTEQRDFSGLEQLVAEKELAEHWQATVKFLNIFIQNWPGILAEEGCIDPADRRNRVLMAQAEAWRSTPPAGPVIAAGSTGSMPATAKLLEAIASLPQGAVILPGLDQALPEDAWAEITESHPQSGMKKLLEQFDVKRIDVKLWDAMKSSRPGRVRLIQESMRPAEVSEEWRNLNRTDIPPEATIGLKRLTLDHPQEEAQAIALLMRHALETPGKTAALVTPDRKLAERVSVILDRWNIRINDSGGTPLSSRPIGSFLIDTLAAAAPDATPVDMLSLLKHPLAACGLTTTACRMRARHIEIDVWRMANTKDIARRAESETALGDVRQLLQPVTETWRKPLPLAERIAAHIKLAERIAATENETGAARVWHGEEGETASTWLDDWATASRGFPLLTGADYMELFKNLIHRVTMRSAWGLHPRLSILGPLEARLIHTDLVILGGLNEGTWPPEAQADPWMSRPMKKKFGLPLPERRIGLSAHDFVQMASAKEVVLTRAARMEWTPSVPSRFVLQLETVLRALGYSDDTTDILAPDEPWQEWAWALDEPPPDEIRPCPPPEPRPAAEHRPAQLSVTEIGTWQRNPYAIYAKHILKLNALDPLEAKPEASDRGMIIHETLDAFVKKYPQDLPENALDELLTLGKKAFSDYADHPEVQAFWWPRFERVAEWFIDEESARRVNGIQLLQGEAKGRMTLGHFVLKGRADRMEKMPDGTLGIVDYKTGHVPSQAEIDAGYEPQLPLLALIAAEGGFDGIAAGPVSELAYWKLNGGRDGSKIEPRSKDVVAVVAKARAGLEQLITTFADPATPYQAVPKPDLQPRYDDYAHLARLQEWGRTEEDR